MSEEWYKKFVGKRLILRVGYCYVPGANLKRGRVSNKSESLIQIKNYKHLDAFCWAVFLFLSVAAVVYVSYLYIISDLNSNPYKRNVEQLPFLYS